MSAFATNPMSTYPVDELAEMLFGNAESTSEPGVGMDAFIQFLQNHSPKMVQYKSILLNLADEPDELLDAYTSCDAFSAAVKELETWPTMKPAHQKIMWAKLTEWKETQSAPLSSITNIMPRTPSLSPSSVFGIESTIWSGSVKQSKRMTPPPGFELEHRPGKLDVSYSDIVQKEGTPLFKPCVEEVPSTKATAEGADWARICRAGKTGMEKNAFAKFAENRNVVEFIPKRNTVGVGWCRQLRDHGHCYNEGFCIHGHSADEVEPCWIEKQNGMCNKHGCNFLHTTEPMVTPKAKTGWCRTFLETGSCPHGNSCWYAHKIEDVQECENEKKYGNCYKRDDPIQQCLFKHSAKDKTRRP
jgi:hypothetical protein